MDAHIELEFKLRADDRGPSAAEVIRAARGIGIELEEQPRIVQEDTYVDDAGFRLTRAGVGMRLRASKRRRLLCVKAERGSKDGAFRRDELEAAFAEPLPERAAGLPDAFRDRIEPLVFDGRLRAIATLRTRRRPLRTPGLEIVVDAVEVRDASGTAVAKFAEVEVEVLDPARVDDARRLASVLRTELGLGESTSNKLERALGILHVTAGTDDEQPVGPDTPIAEAARRVLHRHFRRMQRAEIRVRTSDDAAPVHRLRVACRRMRAALRTFQPWLPARERKSLRDVLRTTSTAFAEVRDLDVLADGLQTRVDRIPDHLRKAAGRVIRKLRRRADAARKAGRDKLRARKRIAALTALQEFVERPPAEDGGAAVRAVAPKLIRAATAEALSHGRSLGPRAPAEAIHRLRILMKRLRYTAECFVDAYGRDLVRFVERTTHLQEVLGEFNDASFAITALRELPDRHPDLRRRELLAVGALSAIEHLRGIDARARFDQIWSEFDSADVRTWLEAVLRTPTGG